MLIGGLTTPSDRWHTKLVWLFAQGGDGSYGGESESILHVRGPNKYPLHFKRSLCDWAKPAVCH